MTDAERGERTVYRLRIVAACAALTAMAFVQAPGRIVGDTKVDLPVQPGSLLARALHLWDPSGSFGQVQNQAYGYLWPMGPFFYLGDLLALPPWAIQRLWWALVLCVAFTGLVRLAGRLRIGTPSTRIVAGLAFALAPRFLTSLGPISIEAWPSALAPWVLLPLVGVVQGAPLWRAAARSALAVACVGGVNAAATAAVLPLPFLFLFTLRPRWLAVRLGAYWVFFVGLATAWWLGPLKLLGQYSPPFLNFIETANATTFPTNLVEVLRGTSHWVAYMADSSGPIWFAGWLIVTNPIVVLDTVLLTALGLLGLARRGMPYRTWLISGVLVGVACVAFGHLGSIDGLFAQRQHDLLDGLLAPLRNVHKYDVILRLPLALGLAHMFGLIGRAGSAWRSSTAVPARAAAGARAAAAAAASGKAAALTRPPETPAARALAFTLRPGFLYSMAIIALIGTAIPALAGAIPTRGSYKEVPEYWRETAAWLDKQDGRGSVLVAPASNFAEYEWGRTVDEILQPLLSRPWATRNAIPLAPPGTIRMLDEIEDRISTGDGSPALADVLARSGVKYLLIRNDLDYGTTGAARPLLVHQALDRSPGIVYARGFSNKDGKGNQVPLPSGSKFMSYMDKGLAQQYPAVEVYRVDRPVKVAEAYSVNDMTVVSGGPESLLPLAEAKQLGPAPAVLSGDKPPGLNPTRGVLTDDLRRREVAFGALHGSSATLTADAPFRLDSPTHDYLPTWAEGRQTVVRYIDADTVDASSSRSDATAFGGPRPEHTPFAAIDDDLNTSWRSDPGRPAQGEFWRVKFSKPVQVSQVGITFDVDAAQPTRVRVTTDSGSEVTNVGGSTAVVVLAQEPPTRSLKITIEAVEGDADASSVGISNVGIPGVTVGRTLVTPAAPTARPVLSFSQSPAQPAGCYWGDGQPFCAPSVSRPSEDGRSLDRTAVLPSGGAYQLALRARPRPSEQLNALLDAGRPGVAVTASSSWVPDAAGRPAMAADDDRTTGWVAAPGDKEPTLRLAWKGARPISGIRLLHDRSLAASYPQLVRITSGDINMDVKVSTDGYLKVSPPIIADNFTITFLDHGFVRSTDPFSRQVSLLPVGVSEVELLDVADPRVAHDRASEVKFPCGSGPTVKVGSTVVKTAITATRAQLIELAELPAVPCGGPGTVTLAPGSQRFTATAAPLFDVTALTLIPEGQAALEPKPRPIGTVITEWNATDRAVEVERRDEPGVLAIRENVNPGWRATLDGEPLESFTVDGWQQGWILPPGAAGTVKLTFQPDGQYRLALGAGAVGLAFVLLIGLLPARRPRKPAEAWGGWGLLSSLGAIAIVLFGGLAGVVLLVLLTVGDAALWWWGTPRLIRKVRWVAPAAAYGLAGMLLTAFPWPKSAYFGDNAITQLLVLAALTALWVTCGAGEWLAETVAGSVLRRRGSSPPPPDTPQRM